MILNLVNRNINKIKLGLAIVLLSVFLFESACSATGKTYKRYQQVPCPCMKNHR
jgi:hypothetical protein